MSKITLSDIFGNPIVKEGTILASKTHGFEDKYGSWSLYGGEDWAPAEFLEIRWKRKRKSCWVQKSFIISIEED